VVFSQDDSKEEKEDDCNRISHNMSPVRIVHNEMNIQEHIRRGKSESVSLSLDAPQEQLFSGGNLFAESMNATYSRFVNRLIGNIQNADAKLEKMRMSS
jgi:hypothetical protein